MRRVADEAEVRTPYPVTEGVQRHRLPNGLTVLTREDHSNPIVSTMIWYRVGSRNELAGSTGLSHFLEHMMFKGSTKFGKGEIDAITTRNGGTNNAFTSQDYTAYFFSFASDRWLPSLEIEADRMQNCLFDPEEFRLEQRVVIEELKMELDDPWGDLRQQVDLSAFQTHPYRNPVIGLMEDLRLFNRDTMQRFYERFYCPSNAVLTIVGDFGTSATLKQIERLFGTIPGGEPALEEVVAEPPPTTQVRLEVRRNNQVARLLLAFPAPSVRQQQHYRLHLLDKVLAEGRLSRLYRRLVEEETLVSFVSSDFADTYDPYLLHLRMELLPRITPERVLDVIFEETDKLATRAISRAELRRAKNQCIQGFLSSFETTLDQAVQLGLMEVLDRYEYWDSYPVEINRLTCDDVQQAANQFLTRSQATIGICH